MDKKIGKLIKVVRALTQLALEIGTLIAVIKMIIESIQQDGGGKPPLPENIPESICKSNMKNILKLVAAVAWLFIVVIGMVLLFT